MPKRIRGVIKNPGTSTPASLTTAYGYRSPWDVGKASYNKRIQRIRGVNRPSE